MAEAATRPPGARIERVAVSTAGLLVVSSLAGALAPEAGGSIHALVALTCFAAGTGLMVWAYAVALARSRTEEVSIAGLFFLAGGVAPAPTRRALYGALAAEVVAVVAAASIRPFTQVAFGVLAPMLGLGLMALWGARHGSFPARPERPVSRPARDDGGECGNG
jgi:hypothetical protein